MADNDSASEKSESTTVATPPPLSPKPTRNVEEPKVTTQFLYEDPEFARLLNCYKAFPFLKTTLAQNSVIFSFPGDLFTYRHEAYQLIEKEIGSVVGKVFIPLSDHYPQSSGKLILNTKFCDSESTKKAVHTGLNINGVQYKAILYKNFCELNDCIAVDLTLVPADTEKRLVSGLKTALQEYGEVMQIKRVCCNGYSDGNITITLHRTGNNRRRFPPKRILLSSWGTSVPATCSFIINHFCIHCYAMSHTSDDCRARK